MYPSFSLASKHTPPLFFHTLVPSPPTILPICHFPFTIYLLKKPLNILLLFEKITLCFQTSLTTHTKPIFAEHYSYHLKKTSFNIYLLKKKRLNTPLSFISAKESVNILLLFD